MVKGYCTLMYQACLIDQERIKDKSSVSDNFSCMFLVDLQLHNQTNIDIFSLIYHFHLEILCLHSLNIASSAGKTVFLVCVCF